MKAADANLLEFLKKGTQFVVPTYQRVYSWEIAECERLWDDVIQAGRHDSIGAHFTGSIVYVEKDQGTRTSSEPDLIIDVPVHGGVAELVEVQPLLPHRGGGQDERGTGNAPVT